MGKILPIHRYYDEKYRSMKNSVKLYNNHTITHGKDMDIDTRYNINDGELYVHMIQIFELVPGKDYEAEWII